MEISGVNLLSYKEVLEEIKNQENHLLLGNGFNRGLGINTSYAAIFQKMIEDNYGVYKDAESIVKNCDYDLELFIEELENIFISTTKFNENVVGKAISKFPDKNISFIDINTISYQTTEGV